MLSLVGFDLFLQAVVSTRVAIVVNLKPNMNCAVFGVKKRGNEEVEDHVLDLRRKLRELEEPDYVIRSQLSCSMYHSVMDNG